MDLSKIKKLYDDNLDQFGVDSKSVGWTTADSQSLRFKKLLSVVDDKESSFSLNELGCGYGELFKYCEDSNYNLNIYNGYDISSKMLDAAKVYLASPKAFFFKNSVIDTKADYTITSGIFNVMFDHEQNSWEDHIKQTLINMFENSTKGISFNLLTSYVDYEADNLYYAEPEYFFNFCKRELSKYVSLIHDYNLYEWTILVKR